VPSVQFKRRGLLIKRLHAIKEAKGEFCDRWVKEVFATHLKQSKLTKLEMGLMDGDIVLRKDETVTGQNY
jgi:hypothetical protein